MLATAAAIAAPEGGDEPTTGTLLRGQVVLTSDSGTTESIQIAMEEPAEIRPASPAPTPLKEFQFEKYLSHRKVAQDGSLLTMELTNLLADDQVIPTRASHRFWLVGPPGGQVDVQTTDIEWLVRSADEPTTGPFTLEQDTAFGRTPHNFTRVTVTEVDHFRQVALFRVDLGVAAPVARPGGGQAYTAYLKKMTYTVRIPEVPEGQGVDIGQEDPYLVDLLNKMVVNKDHISLSARPAVGLSNPEEFSRWNDTLVSADREGLLAMAKLPRGGIYSLNAALLREAGYRPEDIPVDRIRVMLREEELAAYPINVANNRLIGEASLVFYVHENWQNRTPYCPLWVMLAEPEAKVRRLTLEPSVSPRVNSREAMGTSEVVIFQPGFYNHRHPVNGPFLRWGTAEVMPNSYYEHEFEVRAPQEDAVANMTFWAAGLHPTYSAEYSVFVNEHEIHSGEIRGVRAFTEEIQFPTSYLHTGTNTLSVYNREPKELRNPTSFSFLAARMNLPVTTSGILPNHPMLLQDDALSSMTILFNRLPDLDGPAILMDVTKPLNPRLIPILQRGNGPTSSYMGTADFLSTEARVVLGSVETHLPIPNLARVELPRSFSDARPADYLMIYHPDVAGPLQQLANHRRTQFAVDALSVEDIYVAFSYGEVSYQAIHAAIRHAYATRTGKRLQKVVLVGEGAEYWMENRIPSRHVSPNMVPVFGWADPTVTIHGDDSYSLIAGTGPLADVEIGRLSVMDEEQLQAIINKTIQYETAPPRGQWRTRHLFVADDEPEFENVVNEIVEKTIRGAHIPRIFSLKNFPYEDYFRGIWRKRSTSMTDQVLQAWNDGALTVTYMGHGGPNLWSSERILHIRDIERMEDGGRHPFMLAGSCDTGWVDYPVEPVKASLAEQLLRREGGGVIGGFIPIDGTSSYEHNFLLTAAFDAMFEKDIRDIGTISLLSKIDYHLHRNNGRVTNQYLLMGDPGVRLPAPMRDFTMRAEPKSLLSEVATGLEVDGRIDRMQWGIADVTLMDPTHREVATKRFRVANGAFAGTFELSGKLKSGTHHLVAVAMSEGSAAQSAAHIPIEILPTLVSTSWSSDPEMEEPVPANSPVKFTVTVTNGSSLPIPGATVELRDGRTGTVHATLPATLAAGGTFSHEMTINAPAGVGSLEAHVFAKNELRPESPLPVGFSSLALRAKPEGTVFAEIDDSMVVLTPDGKSAGTRVSFPIHNLSDRVLGNYAIRVLAERDGNRQAIGMVQPLDTIPVGGSALFSFTSQHPLDISRDRLHIEYYSYTGTGGIRMLHTRALELGAKKGPNLVVLPDEFYLENEKPRSGTTVFVRFRVKNAGDEAAYQVRPALYLNEPWIERNKAPNAVPWADPQPLARLDPGEEADFRLRWDPHGAAGGTHDLYATATSLTQERDLSDNSQHKSVSLLSAPNLGIAKDDVWSSHIVVQPYDRVRISVPIINDSPHDFLRDFRVTATAISTAGERTRLFTRRMDALLAGHSATLQFDWQVRHGQHQVEINLNEDREYLESTYNDNLHLIDLPYVLDSVAFDQPLESWSYHPFLTLAGTEGLNRTPGGRFVLKARPAARSQMLRFTADKLVEGELGTGLAADNLVGIREDGIVISQLELAPPVKFRFDLDPSFRTTYHDISMGHLGRRDNNGFLSGVFRYRLQDEKNWKVEDRPYGVPGYFGRIDTKANHLIFEMGSTELQALNHISSITMVPVMGIITGPIVKSDFFPRGQIIVHEENEGSSRIDVEVRYGHGTNEGMEWENWQLVDQAEPLSPAPEDARYFQWRAFLYGAADGDPLFRGIEFKVRDDGQSKRDTRMAHHGR